MKSETGMSQDYAQGKIRSAGVFVASITFSTRTPGSTAHESMAPRVSAAMAATTIQPVVRALMTLCWIVKIPNRSTREVRQWPSSNLAFEAQMMTGRAAFGLEGWNEKSL